MDNKQAYISNIQIEGLCGSVDIDWRLQRGVNIISGINGSGKSTIIQALKETLINGVYIKNNLKPIDDIKIIFENGDILPSSKPIKINIDVVSTFDSDLQSRDAIQKLTDNMVRSDLDWQLYKALERYLKYQLKKGKQAIDFLMSGKDHVSEIDGIMSLRTNYFDIIDSLFKESNKTIIRDSNDMLFKYKNRELTPYQLSSGEKQMIVILTTVLTQDREPYILIMDEPEISLHFEWQKSLLENIMKLNPNLQIITSTHSPAMVMQGWISRVQDIEELSTSMEAKPVE